MTASAGGSVFKRERPDGKVEHVCRVEMPRGPGGKRRRKEFVRRSRKEAIAARDAWLASPQSRAERRSGTSDQSMAEVIGAYVEAIERAGTKRSRGHLLRKYVLGVHGRAGTVGHRIEPTALASMAVASATRHHVREVVERVEARSSRTNLHKALRGVFDFAVERGWIEASPLAGGKAPKRQDSPITRERVWSPEQCRTFAGHPAVAAHPLGAMFSWWLRVGLRGGEVYALRWDDVDLDRKTITVRATMDVGDLTAVEPKTLASHRTIEVDDEGAALLAALPLRQGWVWPGLYGRPLKASGVLKALARLCEDAGVPRRTTHELRHTHATLLLLDNVPPHEVAARLGHSSAVQTLRTYAHFIPSHGRSATSIARTLS